MSGGSVSSAGGGWCSLWTLAGPFDPLEEPLMTKRFGYPLLGLFVLYLISLNAAETGRRGNDFLAIVGGLASAMLDFLRGLAGDGAITQALGVVGL